MARASFRYVPEVGRAGEVVGMNRALLAAVLAAVLVCLVTWPVSAAVDIVWQPSYQVVRVGQTFSLGLHLVSSDPGGRGVSGFDAVMRYDDDHLRFQNFFPDGAPYGWLINGFLWPSPEGINDALDDGDMLYTAWAQLGLPAVVGAGGLLASTLDFIADSEVCSTEITIVPSHGVSAKTDVYDGQVPNTDVRGSLGSALVKVVGSGVLMSVVEAKALPDESLVTVAGPIVTRAIASPGCFYIEDCNRAAGIRVNYSGSLPLAGAIPSVIGMIRTTNGERVIDASEVSSGEGCARIPVPEAFGVLCRATMAGLSPQGLLMRMCGHARSVSGSAFTLDDGSPCTVRVELHGVTAPSEGEFVVVEGVLGADGATSVLRVTNEIDMQKLTQ